MQSEQEASSARFLRYEWLVIWASALFALWLWSWLLAEPALACGLFLPATG